LTSSRRSTSLWLPGLFAIVVVLFFSGYGNTGTVAGASQEMIKLIINTLHGQDLRANFWTVTWGQVYYSLRLVVVSTVFAVVLGVLLVLLRVRTRRRYLVQAFEVVTSALEVVPEAIYVIVLVVLLLLLLPLGINLPVFPALDPTWSYTWIPAFALCMPGAFYIQRIIYLQLRDEQASDYVMTAISKGASRTRAFYRHVLPNTFPTLIRHVPVIAGFILSTVIFTEFFMEYTGVFFTFTNWATGWDYMTGIPLNGSSKPTDIPAYQPGLVFVIGLVLVLLWFLIRISSKLFLRMMPADDAAVTFPPAVRHRIHKPSLIAGCILVGIVLILALFPQLVTHQHPKLFMGNSMSWHINSAQGPSRIHPFGTDDYGRDLFALAVESTFQTLWPAAVSTVLVILVSMTVAGIGFASNHRFIARLVQVVGDALTAVPALFVLFLALYVTQLNAAHQAWHYIFWIVLIESGRGAYAFSESMKGWSQFQFLEGAISVGQSNWSILLSHLRSWLGYFTLEFGFTEFARILSLMVQLAAFHLYVREGIGFLAFEVPAKGVVSMQSTWLSMIGDATTSMLYMSSPYVLYVPVLFLVMVVSGVSLIAKGIRG